MAGVGEKRIPESYIVILQPTVTPYEMLSSVLKGYKPTFTYGSIFTGFAVDRVPMQKADEVSTAVLARALSGRPGLGRARVFWITLCVVTSHVPVYCCCWRRLRRQTGTTT